MSLLFLIDVALMAHPKSFSLQEIETISESHTGQNTENNQLQSVQPNRYAYSTANSYT